MTRKIARWHPLPSVVILFCAACAASDRPFGPGPEEWVSLFDGKTLTHWKSTEFGGEGDVRAEDGILYLDMGATMTGITWAGGPLPKMNYEIRLEAMKVLGDDFFCGLTFPVLESHCSLIVGGWGGGIVGLSSLDGMDASENETTQVMNFPSDRWYKIRVRVTPGKIQAWIDDENVVDVETKGHSIGIRSEMELSIPLGVATWMTGAALRNIQLRRLD